MTWTEDYIDAIIADLASENLFACRTLLQITAIEYTVKVPSLAISLSGKPGLFINLSFLNQHAATEAEVQAVLLHECLHHILGHTVKYRFCGNLLNVALDAIINAIIHRTYGADYSSMFNRFYPKEGLPALLQPSPVLGNKQNTLHAIHQKVYAGSLAADDLHELLEYLQQEGANEADLDGIVFIGNHSDEKVSAEHQTLLDNIVKQLDGVGIWRKSRGWGKSDKLEQEKQALQKHNIRHWQTGTLRLLRRCLQVKDARKTDWQETSIHLPMLSQTDRRAMVGWQAGGLLPLARHGVPQRRQREQATVYLDVSGSMNAVLPHFISLMHSMRPLIQLPLWAFSNEVTPAVFKDGALQYKSTYGTSITCVFDHMRRQRVQKALIVTDGYVEDFDESALTGLQKDKINILLDPHGQANIFHSMEMEVFVLPQLNQ